ncbi:MAG TPA: serine/threonine-protein kinase [Polyangiaceae bacterium]|nr:serine/threonine-protein kinase [Polyangiaceae bacterium]
MAEDVFAIVGSLQAGAFRVTTVVAEGGFAVVYRAHHEGFRADVALKCLKIPGAMSDEQRRGFLQKFQEEGELLFRLSALIPAVVRPLHVGAIENAKNGAFVPFIALEWLEGESLDALITRRRRADKPALDLQRAVALLGPAARALECAHKFPGPEGMVSVLHRDMKPENLFVSKSHGQETLKILDFGIGKVKSVATQIVGRVSSEGGLSAFTPAYGAPEQWLPKRYGQTGTWTDVWGFALTMVELITGRPPLEGDLQAVMGACLDERQRPTPRHLGASVPDAVEAAFKKALALDPKDRYADIGEFWDAIEGSVGIRTPRIGVEQRSHLDSVAPPGSSAHDAIPDLEFGLPARPAKPAPARRPALDSSPDMAFLRNDAGGQLALDAAAVADAPRARPKAAGPVSLPVSRIARASTMRGDSLRPSAGTIVARMMPGLKILMLAAAIMIADIAYAAHAGAPFTIGPARAFWVAGPLGVIGLFKLALGLLGD